MKIYEVYMMVPSVQTSPVGFNNMPSPPLSFGPTSTHTCAAGPELRHYGRSKS